MFRCVNATYKTFIPIAAITRVGGNKKGIFTRNRQPKAAAHLLRSRYHALATSDYGISLPETTYYISDKQPAKHEEL